MNTVGNEKTKIEAGENNDARNMVTARRACLSLQQTFDFAWEIAALKVGYRMHRQRTKHCSVSTSVYVL